MLGGDDPMARRRWRSTGSLLPVAGLALALLITGGRAATASSSLAADTFERSQSSGWGSADLGGAWTPWGRSSDFAVTDGRGQMTLPGPGATRAASLSAVDGQDVDLLVNATTDVAASGSGIYLYAEGRFQGNDNQYRAKLRIAADGRVYLHASRVVNGSQAPIGSEIVVPGLEHQPGVPIWLRAQFLGSAPTTIQLRAWTGATEPAGWSYVATDATASLQQAGSVGLRAYLGSSASAPVRVSWDDLSVIVPGEPTGEPPVAAFSFSCAGLSCSFTDASTNAPTSWSWEFGDGTGSSSQHPSHTFAAAGSYPVSLEVTNAFGSDQHQFIVTVDEPPSDTLARDAFERSRTNGWGSADLGGPWSLNGSSSGFSVAGGVGEISVPPGATRGAWLDAVEGIDVDVRFSVSPEQAPGGSGTYVYALVRRVDAGNAYRPKLRFTSTGAVQLHASRFVAGSESSLAPARTVPGLDLDPGEVLEVRMSVTGTQPTMIRVKAWPQDDPEPSTWGFSITDSTPALQVVGSVGLQVYVSGGTSSARSIVFDDFVAAADPPPPPQDAATLVGAGDIAGCDWDADEGTAAVLDGIPGIVFAAGDLVYQDGTPQEYANCYDPTWGRHAARTLPVIGNHEYHTPQAAGYFGYWGPAAGDPDEGWYATHVGGWRVYVLNSECSHVGGCGPASAQGTWLRNDLAAHLTECTVAILHRPRFSSGSHGNDSSVQSLWQALYDAGTEIVISGHDHDYERFAPQSPNGSLTSRGITEFVVGTGGAGLRPFGPTAPNSVTRQSTSHGVLQLALEDGAWEWSFQRSDGPAFTDSGSRTCF